MAPGTCPDGPQVEGRIYEHLGREGIVPDPRAGLVVRATITRADDRHELVLEIETPVGVSRSEAGDKLCDALAELVAIKVSLALDPVETARQLLPEEKPEPKLPAPEAEPEPKPAPRQLEPPPAKSKPALVLQFAPAVGGGLLPSVDAGGLLSLGVQGRVWQVTFGGLASSGPGEPVAEPQNASVEMVAALGSVTACVLPQTGPVVFPACIGIDAGAIHGRGVDLAVDRSAWSPVVAGAVETGLSWPQTRRVRLLVRARARVHAVRPSFSVGGLGEVHRAGVVGGHVLVGLEALLTRP